MGGAEANKGSQLVPPLGLWSAIAVVVGSIADHGSTQGNVKSMPIEKVFAAARLDRLPITSFHRKTMWLLGLVLLFRPRQSLKHFLVSRRRPFGVDGTSRSRQSDSLLLPHLRECLLDQQRVAGFPTAWDEKGADFHNDLVRRLFTSQCLRGRTSQLRTACSLADRSGALRHDSRRYYIHQRDVSQQRGAERTKVGS